MSSKITNYFISKRWRDRDIYFYLKFNAVSFFLLVMSLTLLVVFRNTEDNVKFLIYSLIGFFIFLKGIAIFSYKGSNFKTLWYSLIHFFMRNEKDVRDLRINNNYITNTVNQVKEELSFDKVEYIQKNISDKQSMVSFIQERDVRNNLILWSEYLPLQRLNLDYKKQLLSHDRMDKKVSCPISKKDLEFKFSLYSEKELLRLFGTYYNFEDYFYCLESTFVGEFPIKKNIKELRDCILDLNETDYLLEEQFPWLLKLDERFSVVKNKRELYDWSEIMSNCLKGYDERLKREESVVVSYCDFGEMLYVIEILPTKGLVKEIKGYKNEDLFKSEELSIKKYILGVHRKYS